MRARHLLAGVAIAAVFIGCGNDGDNGPTVDGQHADGCDPPELLDFTLTELEAANASCATAAAVATTATECYFESSTGECPAVDVGGTRWDCSFQVTGPPGSGGRSRAVCFSSGMAEVTFQAERRAGP